MPRYTLTCPNGHVFTFGQIAQLKTSTPPFCYTCLSQWDKTEIQADA